MDETTIQAPERRPGEREEAPSTACRCLLCGSGEIAVVERLSTSDIARCYEPWLVDTVKQNFRGRGALSYCHCTRCDLRFFSPGIGGSQEYYAALQKFPWYYLEDKPEYELAARWISSRDRILEIGCGSGAFSRHIDAAAYTGLEFSPEAIRSATQRGLEVSNACIEQFADGHEGQYDVVCAFQVLEHVLTPRDFIAASARCLKTGGLLILCVPSEDSFVSLLPNNPLNLPPHHITRWTDKALKNMARLFPLELIAIEHEQLAGFHKNVYAALLLWRTLSRLLRRKEKHTLVDRSFVQRALISISYRLSGILAGGLDAPGLLPRGHSVTAILRKTSTVPGPARLYRG